MKLPNAESSFVDLNKLRNYSLNAQHFQGRHKARVFAAALDMTAEDAEELREQLLAAAQTYDAIPTKQNEYGQYYQIDFAIARGERRATIRSGWIIRASEDFPRLTTCYVL